MRCGPNGLLQQILAMDPEIMDQDRIGQLIRICPTTEEVEAVKNFSGDHELLGKTEKFFYAIRNVPKLANRLDMMLFRVNFNNQSAGLLETIETQYEAEKEVESKSFLKILQIVLAFGNYMNNKSKKGGAFGFKLNSLSRLRQSKSTDKKTNTSGIHYCIC